MKFSTKLILLFSGLFLTLCVFITYLVSSSTSDILEQDIQAHLARHALATLDGIDRVIYDRQLDLKLLATEPFLKAKKADIKTIEERLARMLKTNDSYTSLSYFDMSRRKLADTTGEGIGTVHGVSEYWPGIRSGADSVFVLSYSEALQRPIFHVAEVVRDLAGNRTGVLVGRMSMEWMDEILKPAAIAGRPEDFLSRPDVTKVDMVDKNGLIIYSSYDKDAVLKKTSSYWPLLKAAGRQGDRNNGFRATLPGAEEEVVAVAYENGYKTYKGNGCALIFHVPSRIVFARAFEMRNRLALVMAAFGGLSLILILVMASSLMARINALAEGTRRISAGDFSRDVAVTSDDELADLTGAFNAMARGLRDSTDKLRASIREKEVLLREVNHRVKNNLQIVSALISIQADSAKDKNARAALEDCRNRIEAMSMIHSQLYVGSDPGSAEMRSFLQDLVKHIRYSFLGGGSEVSLRVQLDDLRLPTSQAIACGLIVNELVTNALKYAFPGRRPADAAVEISLQRLPDGDLRLTVKDNGSGIPGGAPPPKAGGMGLNLVSLLAKGELKGVMDVQSDRGTSVSVRFTPQDF